MTTLRRLFEPPAYARDTDAANYWRSTVEDTRDYPALEGAQRAEVAVIGAGFTGLCASVELARHGLDVALVDMHRPGWGASGRNGGFACLGGAKASHESLRRSFGEADTARFHKIERKAIDLVAELLERHGIDADRHSNGETLLAHRARDFKEFSAEAKKLSDRYGVQTEVVAKSDLAAQGLNGSGFHGALTVRAGFALNPRKYALGLADAARKAGVRIHADSPVVSITRDGRDNVIHTAQGTLRAPTLLLATNGYSAENLPGWMRARYMPVQSAVLVTRPLSDNEIAAQGWHSDQMAYDTRQLLHYFRLMPDRRFLLGMRGGTRATPAANTTIRARIRSDFETMFPAWQPVETPYFWSGLLCMSRNFTPYVGPIGEWPGAFTSFAYHGNGVAMASYCGTEMARMALGKSPDLADLMRKEPRRFPLGQARRMLLPLSYAFYGLRDR